MKKEIVLQTAENYENLSTGEKWDYCWEADLIRPDWATECLKHLEPCSYLTDLKQLLSLLEAEEEDLQEEDFDF